MLKRTKKIKKRELLEQINQKMDLLLEKYNENFSQLIKKAQTKEEQDKLIKNVRFRLDKAKVFFDATQGIYGVDIKFLPSEVRVYVDNGSVIKNDFIYAISSMNMLSMSDMTILTNLFEQAKERSK